MARKAIDPEWCVLIDNALKCTRCGYVEHLRMPIDVEVLILRIKAFNLEHARCKESQ